MSRRWTRRGSLAAIAAAATLLALPALAAAETFRGQTAQGRPVTIETRPDRELRKAVWVWKTTGCSRGGLRLKTQTTRLRAPKQSRPGFFTAKGNYKIRFSDAKVRFEVESTGRQRSETRWSGTFRAKAFVKLDDGERLTCRLRPIDWAATS